MRSTKEISNGWTLCAVIAVLLGWSSVSSIPAEAQAEGNNTICASQSGCSPTAGSPAFIDASVFLKPASQGRDFCDTIYYIFTHNYPSTGAVIDARGISGTTNLTCTLGSPWFENGSNYANKPSTILLPAGTITIPSTWVLLGGTKLIGEGSETPPLPVPTPLPGATIIQACTNSISGCNSTNFSGTMLQFGSSCPGPQCTPAPVKGISVENVVLNGNGLSITGIQNGQAQELTYVDHVTLFQILGMGLEVTANAENSGPYSNITFDTGAFSPGSSTSCAQILNVSGGTRELHGLTCIGETGNGQAAVLLDSSNNSLEDVRIVGFYDGIRVGANANAQSNVLINIIGDTAQRGERLAAQFHLPAWATI